MMKTSFHSRAIVRLATLSIVLGFSPAACAELFMYTDSDGVSYFTNIPSNTLYERIPTEGDANPKALAQVLSPGRERGRQDYASQIAHAAAETGLPESLLHAVIKVESNYNSGAVSRKGAVGLMQLMPDTARRYGVLDARDPAANVLAGARYLKSLLLMFDADLDLALAAYNAGPAAVMRSGRAVPPYAETRRYIPRVIKLYRSGARP
jgi:soluble lytic murein transglycosylase-like protein